MNEQIEYMPTKKCGNCGKVFQGQHVHRVLCDGCQAVEALMNIAKDLSEIKSTLFVKGLTHKCGTHKCDKGEKDGNV